MYFALIIPVLGCLAYAIYCQYWSSGRQSFNPLVLTSIPITFFVILVFRLIYEAYGHTSTEYRGYLVHQARYYEYWDTWVTATCSRQVPCGENCTTDSNGNTTCTTVYCTEYYDCSYCDEHPAYWIVYDNKGHGYSISEEYYKKLTTQWSSTPKFFNQNRAISNSGSCGCDGDMYAVYCILHYPLALIALS